MEINFILLINNNYIFRLIKLKFLNHLKIYDMTYTFLLNNNKWGFFLNNQFCKKISKIINNKKKTKITNFIRECARWIGGSPKHEEEAPMLLAHALTLMRRRKCSGALMQFVVWSITCMRLTPTLQITLRRQEHWRLLMRANACANSIDASSSWLEDASIHHTSSYKISYFGIFDFF